MKLIFQNSRGEERVIAEPQDKKEAVEEINKFLDDHNYKSYYMNVCEDDNGRLRDPDQDEHVTHPCSLPLPPPATSVCAKNRTHKAHLLIFPNNAVLRIWLASV